MVGTSLRLATHDHETASAPSCVFDVIVNFADDALARRGHVLFGHQTKSRQCRLYFFVLLLFLCAPIVCVVLVYYINGLQMF